jgi:hypothetical protein
LTDAVRRFQELVKNRNIDGIVGPGTRAKLVSALLRKFGASRFSELDASQVVRVPTVFHWPAFEHQIAEQIESVLHVPMLVYIRLDDTPLKAHDPH